jgi:hypothetical protein
VPLSSEQLSEYVNDQEPFYGIKQLKKIVQEITMASTDQREKYSIKQVSAVCEHLHSNLTIYNK